MKIGILGTRGIPNRYGGFEQWAEQLSLGLVKQGCEVRVYNSHFHPYKKKDYKGVEIVHKWDPKRIGLASQFIYDLLCIINARKQNFDIIIQLGYTTSSVWAWLLPKKAKILYNMDGMEWKREKYKGLLKPFLKFAEKLAVRNSDVIIADSKPIKQYFEKKYRKNVEFIAYPAIAFKNQDSKILKNFHVDKHGYYLLIARFQADNNLETIIRGVLRSVSKIPLLVVGDFNNKYGRYLRKNYKNEHIVFLGKIFDANVLGNLRYFSYMYFHGHSAGGTNPSLLEAMASSSLICAHKNKFNESVLENDAFYFNNEEDILTLLNSAQEPSEKASWIENNLEKVMTIYNPDLIIGKYQKLF